MYAAVLCPSVFLSVRLSVCLSVCLSVRHSQVSVRVSYLSDQEIFPNPLHTNRYTAYTNVLFTNSHSVTSVNFSQQDDISPMHSFR